MADKRSMGPFHPLEPRRFLAASIMLNNGVLDIVGTAKADEITVYTDPHALSKLDVKIHNRTWQFDRAAVNSLFVRACRGNDTINLPIFLGWNLPRLAPPRGIDLPSTIYGDGGDDMIFVNDGPRVRVFAGDGNDKVTAGTFGRVTMYGQAGNDQLYGGGGPDLIDGGDGNDHIITGVGNDTVSGGAGNDFIMSTPVVGGSQPGVVGNLWIDGGAGNDEIDGGPGNDSIDGGAGTDTLTGGGGDDQTFGDDVGQTLG